MSDATTNWRIAWHGRSWQLRVVTEKLPDGQVSERAYVHHPGAVVLIPLQQTPQGPQLLLLRQYRLALQQTIWELPAGTRGWAEDWLTCAQRELREETGYRAASFHLLATFWPTPGLSNELMHLYLATELEPDPLPADADEEISLVPVLLAEAREMAQDGRIQDGKTLIALWQLELWLARNRGAATGER